MRRIARAASASSATRVTSTAGEVRCATAACAMDGSAGAAPSTVKRHARNSGGRLNLTGRDTQVEVCVAANGAPRRSANALDDTSVQIVA